MIKSFSGQVVFCFAIPEPYQLTLVKTDYHSINIILNIKKIQSHCCIYRQSSFYYMVLLCSNWNLSSNLMHFMIIIRGNEIKMH